MSDFGTTTELEESKDLKRLEATNIREEGDMGPQNGEEPRPCATARAQFAENRTTRNDKTQITQKVGFVNGNLQPDLQEAQRFLDCLAPGGQFTFQTFDDSKKKNPKLAGIFHGTLAQDRKKLCELNGRGAGIFVTVNQTNGTGRRSEDITGVRSVFADLDGSPLEPVLAADLPPHIVNESSPGRYHAFWLVTEGFPRANFRAVQKTLIARFDSDSSVHDLPRVLRLPGFIHRKEEPFQTKILDIKDHPRYTPDEIRSAFPPGRSSQPTRANALPTKAPSGGPIPESERNSKLTSIGGWLRKKGREESEILTELLRINQERCSPPLDESEVRQIAHSVSRYPAGLPRMSLEQAREHLGTLPLDKNPRSLLRESSIAALAVVRSEDPAAWVELKGRAKGFQKELTKIVEKRQLRLVQPDEGPPTVGAILESLGKSVPPHCEALLVPHGYVIDDHGIGLWSISKDGTPERKEVSPQITLISKRIRDIDNDDHAFEVIYFGPEGPRAVTAPRADFLDSRRLTVLSNKGLPVSSGRAAELSRFYDKFESANVTTLFTESVSSSLGWIDHDNETVFILGFEVFSGNGASSVRFEPRDAGDRQVAAAFHTRGTYEGWLKTVEPITGYCRPMANLCAAFAAPFLHIFGASNGGVDNASRTSTGRCLEPGAHGALRSRSTRTGSVPGGSQRRLARIQEAISRTGTGDLPRFNRSRCPSC